MAAKRAHRRPVVAEPPGIFGQQRVFLDGIENAGEVVINGGQIATGKLAVTRAGIKQRRRRRHEIKGRQHVVELDGAGFAVGFIDCQTHRHAHEESLRQLDARAVDVQEIAVKQGLQAQIAKLEIALVFERSAQTTQIEAGELFVQQFGGNALGYQLRESFGIASSHLFMAGFFAEHFVAQAVEQ